MNRNGGKDVAMHGEHSKEFIFGELRNFNEHPCPDTREEEVNNGSIFLHKNEFYSHLWTRNKEENIVSRDNIEASNRVREPKEGDK